MQVITPRLCKCDLNRKIRDLKDKSIVACNIWLCKSVVADSRHCYGRVNPIWKTNQSSYSNSRMNLRVLPVPKGIITGSHLTHTWAIIISALHTHKIRYKIRMSKVNKKFSFNSDPCTSLPSPHQHRWTARVEKLGSQAYICAFAMTPGSAHMARMKIFINNIEGNGEGKELEASTYGSWDRCAGSSAS